MDGLAAASVPSGSYRVLLKNDVAAQMLRTFSPACSPPTAPRRGFRLLKGREGEMIAAKCLTIVGRSAPAGAGRFHAL